MSAGLLWRMTKMIQTSTQSPMELQPRSASQELNTPQEQTVSWAVPVLSLHHGEQFLEQTLAWSTLRRLGMVNRNVFLLPSQQPRLPTWETEQIRWEEKYNCTLTKSLKAKKCLLGQAEVKCFLRLVRSQLHIPTEDYSTEIMVLRRWKWIHNTQKHFALLGYTGLNIKVLQFKISNTAL